ncbi:MAG: lipoprotein [Oceanospirillaceae bacterium]|nr:lipoprotein [Oceanospirillaceae bacterium]
MSICVKKSQQILKLAAFTSILWLAACGQKGPLYLEQTEAVISSEAAELPQGEEQKPQ